MSEFGHHGARCGSAFIDIWGAGPFLITVEGRTYRFEDSDRFGPYLLNKQGDPLDRQPGERHPFWKAHFAWRKQGRRLDADGVTCIWDPLRPTLYRRGAKVGRGWMLEIVEEGDPDGEMVRVP